MAAIELQGPAPMNEDQHRRRIVLWLGSFPVIAVFVLLILVLLLSDRTAPVLSKIPVALDIITVKNHIRRKEFVSAHLHLNFAYLLEVSEEEEIRIKEDENKDVVWIPLAHIEDYVTEEHMLPIYRKIMDRI